MHPDDLIPVALGLGSALTGGLICYFPARHGRTGLSLALLAVLAAAAGWSWVMAERASGWDAVGYAAVAIVFSGPAFLGGLAAVFLARRRHGRKDRRS